MSGGYSYTTLERCTGRAGAGRVSFYLDDGRVDRVPGAGTGRPHLTVVATATCR